MRTIGWEPALAFCDPAGFISWGARSLMPEQGAVSNRVDNPMRVLVTGHNGYIGSVLTPLLLHEGHDVVGLDTFYFEHGTLGRDLAECPSIRKDLRDVEAGDL